MKPDPNNESTNTLRDPIADLFTGIRFRNKADRDLVYVRVAKYVAQSNAVARIGQDLDNDKKADGMRNVISGLRYELERAHRVWAEQVIEARGGDRFTETIERYNVALAADKTERG